MRHLALLLTLLLATVALAATAKAAPPASLGAPLPPLGSLAAPDPEAAEEADEGEEGEGEEAEACEPEDEEEGACEEEDEGEEADECVLEDAAAVVSSNAGNGKVRVSVRYDASYPATFTLAYSLHGGKGGLRLGSARAHLHSTGTFHDSLTVGRSGLPKLAAARQFVIELHAVGSPGYCRERLTSAAPRRASRKHRAGAQGRSGGPVRTRGS
ncbi:MAG TPA: hypothetical protein VFI17_14045 [Solirubrobacterales bacterium]|nr:hypothetical protein [Solirubrobacterales bacterium]